MITANKLKVSFPKSLKKSVIIKKTLNYKTLIGVFIVGMVFSLSSNKEISHAQVAGNNYYVAPSGNNTNTGALNSPWKTLDYAFNYSGLKPGDTVFIREGVYEEGIININNNPHGAKDALITYKNYPGEQPILKGTALIFKDRSYIRVEGLKFTDLFQTSLAAKSLDKQVSGIEFVNNIFENNTKTADLTFIRVSTVCGQDCTSTVYQRVTDVLIEGNTLSDDKSDTMDDDSDALQIEGNVDYVRLINNTLTNTRSIAIAIAGRTWKNNDALFTLANDDPNIDQVDHLIIKGNKVADSNGTAIYLDAAGDNFLIEDNILTNNNIGIKIAGESVVSTLDYKDGIVRRNLVLNNLMNFTIGSSITEGRIDASSCEQVISIDNIAVIHNTFYSDRMSSVDIRFDCNNNLRFKNNIAVDTMTTSEKNKMYQASQTYADDSSWQIDGNILFSGTFPKQFRWLGTTFDNLGAFRDGTGHDLVSQDVDPLFNNIASTDFSLTANSPAVDLALPLTSTHESGSGTSIKLKDVSYFTDGMTFVEGDFIRIGSNPAVKVIGVNRATNTIEVSSPISWDKNDKVYYQFAGAASDIGAIEFGAIVDEKEEELPTCLEGCPNTEVTELVIPVIADANISTFLPNSNYGKKKHLQVIGITRSALLKFNLAKINTNNIQSAYLKYTIGKYSSNGTVNTYKVKASSSAWLENKVSYNNVPTFGETIAIVNGSKPSEVIAIDITNYLKAYPHSNVSFVLTEVDGKDGLIVESKETTTPAQLVVLYK